MGSLDLRSARPTAATGAPDGSRPALVCKGLGVRFERGQRREDVKSRVHDLIRRRTPREDFWALRGVDLAVPQGEILGVVGRNGAGKSTFCRVLSRILRPDEGSCTVDGRVAALLTFGTGFDPMMTGRENALRNAMMLGMPRRRVEQLLPEIGEFAGIGRFLDEPVRTYSAGMKARLGFSVAAHLEPEILVVDEALSVGDLEFFERAEARLREVVSRCRLVVVVTHRLEFVESTCTRAVWIERGGVEAYGLPQDVVGAYRASVPEKAAAAPRGVAVDLEQTESRIGERTVVSMRGLGIRFDLGERSPDDPPMRSFRLAEPRKPFWALRDVSFDVRDGEIVGIIGANGAGKSTLCKTLAGIFRPDEGESRVHSEISALLTFGTGFHPQLTGRDNIFTNGMMLGMSRRRIREVFDEIVEFAGLERVIDEPVKTYSAGMRQRLGFSIAAILNPGIFIIDEAMNAGDADFYGKASAKLQEMITRARCVLAVTHALSFVERVCTRALWLHKGRLVFDGDPKEAVYRYRDMVYRQVPAETAATRELPPSAPRG